MLYMNKPIRYRQYRNISIKYRTYIKENSVHFSTTMVDMVTNVKT